MKLMIHYIDMIFLVMGMDKFGGSGGGSGEGEHQTSIAEEC